MRCVVAAGIVLGSWVAMSAAMAQDSRPGRPGLSETPAAPGAKLDEPTEDSHIIGMVATPPRGAVRFDVVRSQASRTAAPTLGLRARVTQLGSSPRAEEAVVAAAEVPALRAAVGQLVKLAGRGDVEGPAAPTWYRFGALGIGIVPREERQRFYVSVGEANRARITLTLEELNQLGTLVGRAEQKIRELEGIHKKQTNPPG